MCFNFSYINWNCLLSLYKLLLVTPAYKDPLPGWVDSLNGPTGILVGAGKGVLRSMICNGELMSEVIPVDIAVNGLIVLPYYQNTLESK